LQAREATTSRDDCRAVTRHFTDDIYDDDERSSVNVTRGPLHVIIQRDAQHLLTTVFAM